MHGVALHSLALCNFAESVRWHEKVPLSIVVAVPRVGGLGTKFFSGSKGGPRRLSQLETSSNLAQAIAGPAPSAGLRPGAPPP